MATAFDALRFAAGLLILLYAAVEDLRTRRVANSVWIWGAGFGAVLFGIEWGTRSDVTPIHLLIMALIVASAYVLWHFHLLAGGADAKALMMLAVLLPLPLHLDLADRALPLWTSPFPPALVVLANSVLAFLAAPFLFLAWNAARGDVRFPAMLVGYRIPIDEAKRRFVWVMERPRAGGGTSQILFASRVPAEEHERLLEVLREGGATRVWVTPKIPFMVPLLAGFVAAFTLGDLVTHFLVEPILQSRLSP